MYWFLQRRSRVFFADDSCNRPEAAMSDILRNFSERLQTNSFQPTFMGRDFFFKMKPVPRYHYTDKRVFEAIAKQVRMSIAYDGQLHQKWHKNVWIRIIERRRVSDIVRVTDL